MDEVIRKAGYNVLERLGQGAYGEVYAVEKDHKQKVVKISKNEYSYRQFGIDPASLKEIDILTRIRHIHVLHADAVFIQQDQDCYVLIEMRQALISLFDLIYEQDTEDSVLKKLFFHSLCGVNVLHKNFVVHSDLKPSNILIFSSNNTCFGVGDIYAKVADFGLSFYLFQRLRIPEIDGTYYWLAPEFQLDKNSGEVVSSEMDVFSMGIIWLETFYRTIVLKSKDKHSGEKSLTSKEEEEKLLNKKRRVLEKLATIIGPPPAEFLQRYHVNMKFHKHQKKYDKIPAEIKDLLFKMISWLPEDRPSLEEVIHHPYFDDVRKCNDTGAYYCQTEILPKQLEKKEWTEHRRLLVEPVIHKFHEFPERQIITQLAVSIMDNLMSNQKTETVSEDMDRASSSFQKMDLQQKLKAIFECAWTIAFKMVYGVSLEDKEYEVQELYKIEPLVLKWTDYKLFYPDVDSYCVLSLSSRERYIQDDKLYLLSPEKVCEEL